MAEWFRARGIAAVHVDDIGLRGADDDRIWQHATQTSQKPCVIVTKDEDFIFLQGVRSDDVRIVWVRLGNCSNQDLVAAFERSFAHLVAGLQGGTRIIEIIP